MLFRLLNAQIRSSMAYRLSFILDLIQIVVFGSMQFLSMALIFARFESLGGWNLGEITLLWSIVEMGFGLSQAIFSGFEPRRFSQQIRLGSLDQMMLRPISITTQVFGAHFELQHLARPVKGIAIFILAISLLGLDWTPQKVLFLPIAVLGTLLYFGSLFIVGATSSFWTVDAMDVIETAAFGSKNMMSYPFHIYPDWLRQTFTYVIPAGLLNYYPALFLLDKPDPIGLPPFVGFLAPLAGLTLFGAALLFWNYGLQHYQSTGT